MNENLEVFNEKKKIFQPKSTERLLEGWLLHAHKGRNRHDYAARRYDQIRIWLGGTAAVVSAIVATSASLSAALIEVPTIKIIVALLGTSSAILIGLSTFLNLAERAEKHRSAGVRYKEIIRELEKVLSSHSVKELKGEDQLVVSIQKYLDDLEKTAPVVTERIYERVEREWKNRKMEFVPFAERLLE